MEGEREREKERETHCLDANPALSVVSLASGRRSVSEVRSLPATLSQLSSSLYCRPASELSALFDRSAPRSRRDRPHRTRNHFNRRLIINVLSTPVGEVLLSALWSLPRGWLPSVFIISSGRFMVLNTRSSKDSSPNYFFNRGLESPPRSMYFHFWHQTGNFFFSITTLRAARPNRIIRENPRGRTITNTS